MPRSSKFRDLQEEEGPRFKSLYFKKRGELIQAARYSLSDGQRQLTLHSEALEGTLTLGPANTSVIGSDVLYDEKQIEITLREDTVLVLLDDENFYECTKIKYTVDSIYENLQILCANSSEYLEVFMDGDF